MDFDAGQVIEEIVLKCSACGLEVYQCRDCDEYFHKDNPIYCMKDGRHLCRVCCEDFEEEKESELNQKQQLKQEEK